MEGLGACKPEWRCYALGWGNPPSLEDTTPGPRASVLGSLLEENRSSFKYNTHWASLCLAIDYSCMAKRRATRDDNCTWSLSCLPSPCSREEAQVGVTCTKQLSCSCSLGMGALPGKTLVSVLIRMWCLMQVMWQVQAKYLGKTLRNQDRLSCLRRFTECISVLYTCLDLNLSCLRSSSMHPGF